MSTEPTSTDTASEKGRRSGPTASLLRWIEGLSETQFAYLLLGPVFLILGFVAFWPLASTFEMSLHANSLTEPLGEFIGLDQYVRILTGEKVLIRPLFDLDYPLQSAIIVTFLFTIVSVAFETIIGFGQALVLDRSFRGRRFVRVAIILPWAVPIVIQGMIFYLMFDPTVGFASQPLQQLGLLADQPFNDSASSLLIVIVADIWKTSAFMALLILAGLQSVDRDLYDVAKVAGASRWQRFRRVTLPLILPAVLVAVLFRTIGAMRVYGLVVASDAGCSTVPTLSCLVVETLLSTNQYATAAAVAFITAVIIGVFVSIYIVRYAQEVV
ncbi:carbohydrate ABC transporter permease [Halocatena salina]|uniref:Sugar ABC transporter permease n=1 Tax=Halocatena salina TaxID=2934340 RepID=A0A8U0A4D6_9EURY|nr:sugar ABC transporter permease [Halocatena salina]UPM43706.1 sugar ABC transporter permease [Halocatena salina]